MNLEELGEVGTKGKLIIPVERTLPLPPYRYIRYFWAAPGGGAWWVVVSGIGVVAIANRPRKLFSIPAVAFVCNSTPLASSLLDPPPDSSPILS